MNFETSVSFACENPFSDSYCMAVTVSSGTSTEISPIINYEIDPSLSFSAIGPLRVLEVPTRRLLSRILRFAVLDKSSRHKHIGQEDQPPVSCASSRRRMS